MDGTFTHNNQNSAFVKRNLAANPVLAKLTEQATKESKYWLVNAYRDSEDMTEAAECFVIENIHATNKFTAMNLANDILRELGEFPIFTSSHKWA